MLQDIRFASRLLLKDRSFTLTCLLTLAVCIGANTAIFSIVRSVVLKPLPVPDSNRIMLVYNSYPNAGGGAGGSAGVPDYFDRVQGVPAFAEQALYRRSGLTLGRQGRCGAVERGARDAVVLSAGESATHRGPHVHRAGR